MPEMFALLVVKLLRFDITFLIFLSEFSNVYLRTITSTKSYHMYFSNFKYLSLQTISYSYISLQGIIRIFVV